MYKVIGNVNNWFHSDVVGKRDVRPGQFREGTWGLDCVMDEDRGGYSK